MTAWVVHYSGIKMRLVISLLVVGFVYPQLVVPCLAQGDDMGRQLYAAVEAGDESEVRKLIDRGANVSYVTAQGGWTCLHLATNRGWTNIVKLLLAAGADPSPQEDKGWTPLHMAAYYGHHEIAEALLEGNARTDLKMNGSTPLDLAVRTNNDTIADLISARGGAASGSGIRLYNAASTGDLDTVKRLVGMQAPVDYESPDGYTPLHIAAFAGHVEIVHFLLANGADMETTVRFSYTPLASAAKEGHAAVVKTLAEAGANVNHRFSQNVTALHAAAEANLLEVATVLLDHDAEPNQGESSDPPLFYAVQNGHLEMVNLLVERGADVNPEKDWVFRAALHIATKAGNLEMSKLLIKLGARPNVLNFERQTPLDFAIKSNNQELVDFLESKGAVKGETIEIVPEEAKE